MKMFNVKIVIFIFLYKIYIFKTCWTQKPNKKQRQKSEQDVFQIVG